MILLSSTLKNDRNWDSHNQNSQLKKFEKNLSSASVGDEPP